MQTPIALLTCAALIAPPGVAVTETPAASNVVVLRVRSVAVPARLPGPCLVIGEVDQVWQGQAFAPGQTVNLRVPCSDGKPRIERGPERKTDEAAQRRLDPEALRRSTLGLVHLTHSGRLIWSLSAAGAGPWGRAWGYRVIGGSLLPLDPARAPSSTRRMSP